MILKKAKISAASDDARLLNINSAEEFLKNMRSESIETVENLEDCFNRTQYSRSLVQNFFQQDAIAYKGDIKINFKRFSDKNNISRLESSYVTEPSIIKSYETIVLSQFSEGNKSPSSGKEEAITAI